MQPITIKISNEKPPVYARCKAQFGVSWERGIIITYGDTVHLHPNCIMSEDLKRHEETHVRQQLAMGKELWWEKYFTDVEFRLSQEVEAYRNQMEYANIHSNRHYKRKLKAKIIKDMSSLYGSMCTPNQAAMLIA